MSVTVEEIDKLLKEDMGEVMFSVLMHARQDLLRDHTSCEGCAMLHGHIARLKEAHRKEVAELQLALRGVLGELVREEDTFDEWVNVNAEKRMAELDELVAQWATLLPPHLNFLQPDGDQRVVNGPQGVDNRLPDPPAED